jgi:transcriptional regulator with XRE-family HTH domain
MRELSVAELGNRAWRDKRRPDVYVWRYEAGQVTPRRDSIERLAKVLNVKPLDLLSDKKTLDENAAYLLERNNAAKL